MVRKIAWATDVHLNFVERQTAAELCARIRESGCAALLLGGDIADAVDLGSWLRFLDAHLDVPIYFVLGNHDYYGGAIATVRAEARSLVTPTLQWLPATGVVALGPETALVGHGGWGDARLGDFMASEVILNDYLVIEDLRTVGREGTGQADWLDGWANKPALKARLEALGVEAAETLRPQLEKALAAYPTVIVLTHVPPFEEACWYEGRISGADWLPGFTCRAMGDMLVNVTDAHPEREVTVLCGHTHSPGETRPLDNLLVITGGARYGEPDFRILEIAG